MTMEVLQNQKQIAEAREILVRRGASVIDTPIKKIFRKLGLLGGINVGDVLKSWDVLSTIQFLEENVDKDSAILDIGCFASEILVSLHKLGFNNLCGVDLNIDVNKMPNQDDIKYIVTDFMNSDFKDCSFDAITSISVIEHGFNGQALLSEISRLLKQGGYFIASFDYWPEKIDTSDIKFFDMDWLIFSSEDIRNFIEQAAEYGLIPFGNMNYAADERAINCSNQDYTFAWMALKKIR